MFLQSRFVWLVSLFIASTCWCVSADANTQLGTQLPRESRVPGGVAILPVADAAEEAPIVMRDDRRVWVTKAVADGKSQWVAVVGIPLSAAAGEHTITAKLKGQTKTHRFTVKAKSYPVQKLTIPDKTKVNPPPVEDERIARERAHLGTVMRTWTDATTTSGAFIIPSEGRLSSRFGLKRVLNGQPRNPHAGLDVAIPVGTPVNASADAVVLDTGDYYFNGKTVFLDHGNSLLSMYIHLDDIKVKKGDVVKQGQLIALSGVTGRVTGPHLHWSVLLNGSMVEPELFVTEAAIRRADSLNSKKP
jgi:murein DD-endopeptidase MepM/ murein hydrolase activator NlpD